MQEFNWENCVSNFTLEGTRELAAERAVAELTIEGLRDRALIGACYVPKWKEQCLAFPIVGENGDVIRAHCRSPQRNGDGKWAWAYEPGRSSPIPAFVIGNPDTATKRLIFESQWDGISAIDKLNLFDEIDSGETCLVMTRGAEFSNRLKAFKWSAEISIYAFPQNDKAGAKWLTNVLEATGGAHVVNVPTAHKDLGEWIKVGGAGAYDIKGAIDNASFEQPQSTKEPTDDELFTELLARYKTALLTSEELETATIKPRAKLLGEWLREGDLGFIYGERGIGKTWLVCAIATHLSTGIDLDTWKAWGVVPVLYVDGEMAQDNTRDRLKGMSPANKNLHVLHHERLFDLSGLSMNLADPITQNVLINLCTEKKIKTLILDNLSCLVTGVKENDADAWELLLSWLLELRRRRIAVIIVHHAGRSGFMRGTTKREDPAAWIIKVATNSATDQFGDGAKFETSFQKIRNTPTPEWIRLWHFKTESNGEVSIGCEEISFEGKVLQLIQDGLETASEIAEELKCAKSTVSKAAKRLETKNLIEIRKRRYYPRGFMNEK